ncbi:transposable element Tcb1 transposase [Trichonephila clavipes]|nr:transposable element Tcb1 transposase [Trichonephila clavipes]
MWRPCGERLNPAFVLQRHTAPTAGVMVWGAIAYNTWSSLLLIRGTMTAQEYVHDICNHMCCHSCNGFQEPVFNKTMLSLTGQGCHKTVSASYYPSLACSIPRFVSNQAYLGWRVGHLLSLNELEARLQQIWNEMSQDIIQNLYASMPDRTASCIRARGDLTGY